MQPKKNLRSKRVYSVCRLRFNKLNTQRRSTSHIIDTQKEEK
jgi:hypothetical protein